MKISVCMATYNGEKYIEKQLESIAWQTHTADEVIICDDGSKDRTVEIIRSFIATRRLNTTWRLVNNNKNKGYPENFYYASNLCCGDVIFWSDQDDIWHPDKIKRMIEVMREKKDVNLLACRFGLIDEAGETIRTVMAPSRKKWIGKYLYPITLHQIYGKYQWPGMVLAVRGEWIRTVQQKWAVGKIPHDFMACIKASESRSFYQLNEVLAWHRRHSENTAAEEHHIEKLLKKDRKLWEIEKYNSQLEEILNQAILETSDGVEVTEEKYHSMQGRYEALKKGKITDVIKNAIVNHKNTRMVTVICDILIAKQHG